MNLAPTRLRVLERFRALGATALFAIVLATAGAAEEVSPSGEVSAVLMDGATDKATLEKLVELGPDFIEEYFEILVEGAYPIRVGERGNSRRALTPIQKHTILLALQRLPRPRVLAFLASLASAQEEAEKVTALELLGQIGTQEQLQLLLELAAPEEGSARVPLAVRQAFGSSFERVLLRGSWKAADLRRAYGAAHPSLLVAIITAYSREKNPERLELFVALLGEVPEVDPLILAEITRQAETLSHPPASQLQSIVRYYLWRDEPQLLIEASRAASAMEDGEAVPHLIHLIGHEDANVGRSAIAALNSLSGRQLGHDAERWSNWHEAELAWWTTEAQRELQSIRHGRPEVVSRLVLDLSKKYFFRHKLSAPLAAGLMREETDLVALTCAALGHLGSWTSVPHLVRTLGHREDEVKAAAWRALGRITNLELGPDQAAWKPVLDRLPFPDSQ